MASKKKESIIDEESELETKENSSSGGESGTGGFNEEPTDSTLGGDGGFGN